MAKLTPIDELNEKFSEMQKSVEEFKTLARKATRVAESAAAKSAFVKDMVSGKVIDRAKKDADEIHSLYRAVFLKLTVATETAFLARTAMKDPVLAKTLSAACVMAFDLPNSWWIEKESEPLSAWIKILLDIAKNGLPEMPTDTEYLADCELSM